MDSRYLRTGLFLYIPLMTARDSPTPKHSLSSRFHMGQRSYFSALTLPDTGHSYSWPLFISAVAWRVKKRKKKGTVQAGPYTFCPWGVALIKYLSLIGAREHITSEHLLASTTTCHDRVYLCAHRGGTEWSGRNEAEPWNTMITYFNPS